MISNIIQQISVEGLQTAFINAAQPFFDRFGISLADNMSLIMLIFAAVLGILHCLLGYKLLRLWIALFGFFVGFRFTWLGLERLRVNPSTGLVIALIAGVAMCLAAALAFKIGIFLFSATVGGFVALYIMTEFVRYFDDQRTVMYIFVIAIGLAVGGIAVHFMRPILIVVTAIAGGIVAGTSLAVIVKMTEHINLFMAGGLLIALLGILFQFATTKD